MRYTNLNFGILLIVVSCLYACSEQNVSTPFPAPLETIVNTNNEEDEANTLNRELWIERMHKTAPDKNWRQIERKNSATKIQRNGLLKNDELVTLGDSITTGYWSERGSSNQAGSMVAVTYLKESDAIYGISGGGTIWKGDRNGVHWQVVNESYVFDNNTLFFVEKEDQTKRMIANIARIPHYSDDLGITWNTANGIASSGDLWSRTANYETVKLRNGSTRIYCLSKSSYYTDIHLYYSDDLGENYELIQNLDVSEFSLLGFCKPHHSDDIYIATSTNGNKLKIERIDHEEVHLVLHQLTDIKINYQQGKAHLIGHFGGQDSIFYALQNDDTLVKSEDAGATWLPQGKINEQPWDVGFYISPSDANQVYYGALNAYKKQAIGFTTVNEWYDYYNNVESKLHADIMSLEEFESPNGEQFLLIGNHGGLSISYDYMATTQNIGMEGLNVAQYYDVRTDPLDPRYVYAGSQDQGFQRSAIMANNNNPAPFEQIISGDYGHIVFSRSGQGMWTVYPGGSISYLNEPQLGSFIANYTIVSPDESNWLTPMTDIPHSTKNEILVAGGNIYGESGSHIIRLEYFGGIQVEQFDFDFKANSNGGVITSIEVSPLDNTLLYVTTSDGTFFISRDGGKTFTNSYNSINNGHYLYSTSIYASAINENEVWVAGSGYNNDGILYSDDYGSNFKLFTDGLPSTLVFEVTANADETKFFAATEAGPYIYMTETGKWEDLSQGNAPVQTYWSVEYLEEQEIARFGTYGRGIWDFSFGVPEVNVATAELTQHQFAKVFPNPVTDRLYLELFETNIPENVNLEIYNAGGHLVRKLTSSEFGKSIDFSSFASGFYTLKIYNDNKYQILKVIKF